VIHVPTVPTFDVGPSFTPTVPSGDIFERRRGQMIPTVPASPGGVQTAAAVDQLAAPLPGNGAPQYPGPLRTAAVEGSVVVTFVVDTTGRAEPTSITIISATHALFADAVRQWLARTRYVPAEIHGRRVRQLVQQEVGFNLKQ
jgi:TonB family protein